jgi:hypothetical protein
MKVTRDARSRFTFNSRELTVAQYIHNITIFLNTKSLLNFYAIYKKITVVLNDSEKFKDY